MKHDEDFLDDDASYATGAIAAEIDHKRYAREYGEHVAAPLLEQLAAKDARIAELEKALREMHDASHQLKVYAGRQNGKDVHYYVPHPLLKDQSSPLAEVARKDAGYL